MSTSESFTSEERDLVNKV
jgi:DnaJ family protein B protein 12